MKSSAGRRGHRRVPRVPERKGSSRRNGRESEEPPLGSRTPGPKEREANAFKRLRESPSPRTAVPAKPPSGGAFSDVRHAVPPKICLPHSLSLGFPSPKTSVQVK